MNESSNGAQLSSAVAVTDSQELTQVTEESFTSVTDLSPDDFKRAKALLKKKYILWGEFADVIQFGLMTGKNVLVFGKGGHGKSDMSDDYLRELRVDRFTQSCGAGLTEEKLFGGLNLKKFNETGEIEYLTRNSFMAHEVVVFEELLDAPIHILLSLKDILTSKRFRQGSQQEAIKTKFILCLTNRSRQEVTEDNSIEAFMDRFPLEYLMEWKNYTPNNYYQLLMTVVPELDTEDQQLLADMFATLFTQGTFISPRTAVHAAQLFCKFGVASMRFLQGIDAKTIAGVQKEVEAKKSVRELNKIHIKLEEMKKVVMAVDVKGKSTDLIPELRATLADVAIMRSQLSAIKVAGAQAEDKTKKCTALTTEIISAAAVKIDALSQVVQVSVKDAASTFNKLSGLLQGSSEDGYEQAEVVSSTLEEEDEEKLVYTGPGAPPPAPAPVPEPDESPSIEDELDKVANEYITTGKIDGEEGLAVEKKGEEVEDNGYEKEEEAPVAATT